jgi:hypothetical protein
MLAIGDAWFVTSTLCAGEGPRFVAVIVKVTFWPAAVVSGVAVIPMARSAAGVGRRK